MDIELNTTSRSLSFDELVVGQVYVTGSGHDKVFLCAMWSQSWEQLEHKRIVRLSDGKFFVEVEVKNLQFAPVKAKLVIE